MMLVNALLLMTVSRAGFDYAVLHLEPVQLLFLGFEIMQPTAALLNGLLGFIQPVLQRLHARFKVPHLSLEILEESNQ